MIGDVPNSVYVMRSLLADLKQITRSNGYLTDVKQVKRPDYSVEKDEDWGIVLAEEVPAVLLWLVSEGDPSGRANSAEDRPTLTVYIMGVVKQERGVQEALQSLSVDVRRIMRNNSARTFPGASSTNTHGVITLPPTAKTCNFMYKRLNNTQTAGVFESWWDIEYRSPRATG